MKEELQPATQNGCSQAVGTPRQSLFRAEALEEQQTFWLGRHTLALGLPIFMSSVASAVLVLAAAALLAFGSYARRVELYGIMLPSTGLIQVAAPAAGWVEALDVHDGERIVSGTRLYTLNTDIATRNGDTQQQILHSLAAQRSVLLFQIRRKTEIRDQQNAELHRKIENLAEQIQQMNVQITVKYEFVRQLTEDLADYVRYVARGIWNRNEKEVQQVDWTFPLCGGTTTSR